MKGICACINENLKSCRKSSILELTTGPLSMVLMLHDLFCQKKSSSIFGNRDVNNVILQSRVLASAEISSFFRKLCTQLSIPIDEKYEICDVLEPLIVDSVDMSKKFDLLICDVIESSGLVKQNILKHIKFALEMSSTSQNNSQRVVPSTISIVIAAIECEDLMKQHSVQDHNTLDVDVSSCINDLGSSLLRELWLPTQPNLKFISERIVGASLVLGSSLYESISKVHLRVEETGTFHGIAFWYHIYMNDEKVSSCLNSSENRIVIDTLMENNHYRQAVSLLDSPMMVTKGDILEIDLYIDETSGVFCDFVSTSTSTCKAELDNSV